MAGGYLQLDTLSQGLADAKTDLTALLAAEKSIAEYRIQAETNLYEKQMENIKARRKAEQQLQDAIVAKKAKILKKEQEDFLKNHKDLLEDKAKYEEEFEKHLAKKLAKIEAKERLKAGKEVTQELARSLTNITGDNKLGQLGTNLSKAFHSTNKQGNSQLDVLQGLQVTTQALADFARSLDKSVEEIAGKKGIIDTNLQGSRRSTGGMFGIGGSYWDSINRKLTGVLGVSPLIKRENVVNNLQSMVSRGISFDVEQRAFLETIKDKIATTFDANNSALSRLIRIQQQDTTAGRLGMESALTSFLNNMYETSEYMHEVASSIKSTLEEAESLMGAQSAAAFEYEVQKWMGSMYSVGMSNSAVNSIAGALGQIAAGQISGLTNGGSGNLVIMAANNAGLSLSDILAGGLTDQSTNMLLNAMVEYLAGIYDETKGNNVVQQQFANVFGITASDLKSAANLNRSRSAIAGNSLNYSGMISQLQSMANSMYSRTSGGEMLSNAWSNIQYSMASGIANNPALYGIYKAGTALKSLVGGIDIPLPLIMGTGMNMGLNVADLMLVGALSGGLLDSVATMIGAGGGGGITGSGMLKALEIGTGLNSVTRGNGSGLRSTGGMSVSSSGFIGNAESGAVYSKTMTDATDDNKKTMAEAMDNSTEITMSTVNDNIVAIYNLLSDVTNGTKSLSVAIGNEMAGVWS